MEALLGRAAVLSDPDELLVYESDGLTLFRALADFVVFPTTAEHVSALVKLANREGMPFVARGAGTGLSGGCLPAEGGLVISLMRMNRVLEVDYDNQIAVVEPGLVNLHLSWAVGPAGLLLRARSLEPAGLHHRRQHREQLGRPAHAQVRRDDQPRARPRGRAARRRDRCGSAARRATRRATTWSASSSAPRAPSASRPRSSSASSRSPQAVKTVLAVFDAGRPGLGGGVRHHRARPRARRDGDDRPAHDPGGRGRVRLRLPARRGGRAPDRAGRPRRRHGGAGRAHRARPAASAGAREVRAARDEAERQLLWKGRKSAFGAYGRISPAYMVMDGVIPRTKLPYVLAARERDRGRARPPRRQRVPRGRRQPAPEHPLRSAQAGRGGAGGGGGRARS